MAAGKRLLRRVLIGFPLAGLIAMSGWGYVPLRGAKGVTASWKAARFPLVFHLSDSLVNSGWIASRSDIEGAVRAAMASWQSVQIANIRFADLQTTSLESGADDGINLITIADTTINRGILGVVAGASGAVAQTRIEFDKDTGEIGECDIVLNPRFLFSMNFTAGTYDLQTIMTHELGHALGCDHFLTQNDTMFSKIAAGEFYQRYLSADAIAFAGLTYPNPDGVRTDSLCRISGRITSVGAGILGASVTAVHLDRNLVYATLSEADGSYAIGGLPRGRYAVYAEPLDGPMTPDQLLVQGADAYYQSLNVSFRTAFAAEQELGIDGAAKDITVNLAAAPGAPSLNIEQLGRSDAGSVVGYLSDGAIVVNPGERINLWIAGADTWKASATSQIRILGSGIALDEAQGVKIFKDYAGVPAGIIVQAIIASDAVPGPRTVQLQIGSEQVASTGGIVVSGRSLPQTTLYFPYVNSEPRQYTGIALANAASELPAVVRMSAYDSAGSLFWAEDAVVPSDFSLPAGSQWARLERQYFNLPSDERFTGSMIVESDAATLQGFFLTGDFGNTYLDGAEAFTQGYRQLFFTDVLQDGNTYTEIHLMNIKDRAVSASLSLVGEDGKILRGPLTRSMEPRGKIAESVSQLFGYLGDLHAAHVVAVADVEALAGFSLSGQAQDICGLNALPLENAGSVLYAPQLAVIDDGLPMDTRINLINVGNAATAVTVEAVLCADAGLPLTTVIKSIELGPGAHFSADMRSVFGLPAGQGYIKATADAGGKLLGNIMFGSGDPTKEGLEFVAAIPLFASGFQDFVFAHIAQGEGYYTGMAFFAPQGARITAQAFDNAGAMKGSPVVLELAPERRFVSLLSQLVPETEGQMGGYVRIAASLPVIGFELFGTTDGKLLSAVPPQRLSK
jgi:hypothetical protein